MGVFEFLMLFCFGFSWPFSILKSVRSRSTAGKSLLFLVLLELGYAFGIVHKWLYSRDWVIWMYGVLFALVAVDLALYGRNRRLERQRERAFPRKEMEHGDVEQGGRDAVA